MKKTMFLMLLAIAAAGVAAAEVNVNDFAGATDSARIAAAVKAGAGGVVVLPKRVATDEPARDWWLIDEAVRLPENTTLVIRDCTVKLSDTCRDNFIRSANCGIGIADVKRIRNVRVLGEGNAVLEGAARPRATGDGSKSLRRAAPHRLEDFTRMADWLPDEKRAKPGLWGDDGVHENTYGTDWDKPGESKKGDWRNIGVLLAEVEGFAIENLTIRDAHAWAISLEACAQGRVRDIHFEMMMERFIDGAWQNIENEDGIDLRNGCHHITVENITGTCGDDVVALTAIANRKLAFVPSGSLRSTHVLHNDWTKRETGIHHVTIRNVRARSRACWVVRLLPTGSVISDVVIDTVIDTYPPEDKHRRYGGVLILGTNAYGEQLKDSMRNIIVNNVIGSPSAPHIVRNEGYVNGAIFSNIVNANPSAPTFLNADKMLNAKFSNVIGGK